MIASYCETLKKFIQGMNKIMETLWVLYTFLFSMVMDHLLPSIQSQSLEWTRTSFEQSLAELYTILLEEHLQVALGRGHTKETGNRNFRELLSACVEHVTEWSSANCVAVSSVCAALCVQHRLITILGNCGCQFPWCALPLKDVGDGNLYLTLITKTDQSDSVMFKSGDSALQGRC
jgi:hypothetical protein